MDLLVIGGTSFFGRSLSEQALAAGHHVTLLNRGRTNPHLFPDADHVIADREESLGGLAGRRFDAVVDTCGYIPRTVRLSTEGLATSGWYGFVSSISAYADLSRPGSDHRSPAHAPPFPDSETVTDETYGPLKVACERAVTDAFGSRAALIRPGYIVGPNDPTDRFTYWVRRASMGGRMVAPGPGTQAVQFVDARDLAAFVLSLAGRGRPGVFPCVHPPGTATLASVIETAAAIAGADTEVTWLTSGQVEEVVGDDAPHAFPLWDPAESGAHLVDPMASTGAGLTHRPVAETIADTLTWDRSRPQTWPMASGLTPEREDGVLAALEAS